uniref:Uncharacterized protein n=1 Tax=Piliocolobus tephrosceles TaxID=591936 RepID=A0A8C9GLE9_9PRIM
MYGNNGNVNNPNAQGVSGQNYGYGYNYVQTGYNYQQNGYGNNKDNYSYNPNMNPNGANGGLYDEFSFNELSSTKIRHGFIRKVYSLLLLQLLFTFGFALLATFNTAVKFFILKFNLLFLILGFVLTLPILLTLSCSPRLARKYPYNYLWLLLITIGMTLMVVVHCAMSKSDIVMYALGSTAIVVLGLTIFAFQTKWDFTG